MVGPMDASQWMLPQSGLELYGQNDEPLQFGGVIADGNQMIDPFDASQWMLSIPIVAQWEMEQPILQPPQLTEGAEIVYAPETYHPPETYATSSGFAGAGDQTEMRTEGAEGSYQTEGVPIVDSGSTAIPGGEDRKKKKKEKIDSITSTKMSGKLTKKFMNQLEQWIGTGPKTFDLLYSITKDGCNATTFHQNCDNQGPTVTVLYNQPGSIYGGYTAASWSQSGDYCEDDNAFMFRLQYNGAVVANKFPCKQDRYAIRDTGNYGPTFGSGHDLHSFSGTINDAGEYYPLNGYFRIGHTFDTQGISSGQINNDTMNVTELEVYKVADGKRTKCLETPWRITPEWNMEFLENLKSEIDSFSPPRSVEVAQSKILIIGPVGAGKSSFFNTIASVFRGRITGQAPSGRAEHSITSQYCSYQVRSSSSGKPLKFRLCDTRGLEETQGIDANDMSFLLDGNVPDGYLFNPSAPISADIQGFKKNTTLKDRIHCVCIVIDGSTADILPEKMLEKIKAIQAKMHLRRVPQMVLLTKVDKLCPEVEANTSLVYRSETVQEQVNKLAQLLGIPRSHVLPMKNYETEIELNDDVNILALLCLRQMLRATEDYMFNFLDQAEEDSDTVSGLTVKD